MPKHNHSDPSTRSVLRSATQSLHDRIEAIWTSDAQFTSLATYRPFLTALLHSHATLGYPAAVARADPIEISLEKGRIAALCDDLDCEAPDTDLEMTQDEAWGVGYVLNGSALGADMLLRHGKLGADWPKSYLKLGQKYVKSGGLRRFFDALNAGTFGEADLCKGAARTFAFFERDPDGKRE